MADLKELQLEFRDPGRARRLATVIAGEVEAIHQPRVTLMHVCGSHEQVIARFGLRGLLPKALSILMGRAAGLRHRPARGGRGRGPRPGGPPPCHLWRHGQGAGLRAIPRRRPGRGGPGRRRLRRAGGRRARFERAAG